MKENQTNEIKTVVLHDSQSVSLAEIQARIFMFRGVQVMLDRDLAILYHVATKALNQAVKRNIRRFPERFMFQLTKEEFENWKSQIVTSNIYSQEEIEALKMGARRCPYAFTEQGVAQLSAVLHSDMAEDASVRIMDAFVAMRRFITANAGLFQRVDAIEKRQIQTEQKLDVVLDKIEELSPAVTTEELFGTGCVWDAYSFLSSLVRRAQQRIILIDNFVDERTLLLLDKRAAGVECTVHTRFNKQTELDFEKHNEQNAEIKKIQLPLHIHDRYLIVDEEVWLLGASAKDMGHGLCTVIKVDFTPEMVLSLLK
ncbi:MAG: ORF6N domain-containing protein [Bacteroidales bacterium]|nr:ORF6N domain-containing protein [Bacteroidales bacterium]